MPVALLDVNVLLALALPGSAHHVVADRWFDVSRVYGWATCPLTNLGLLRLLMQPAVTKSPPDFASAFALLEAAVAAPGHEFWPLDYPATEIHPEIRSRLVGHKQLTDALLLDLAIRRNGRLATLDRGVRALLPPDSPHQSAIELIE